MICWHGEAGQCVSPFIRRAARSNSFGNVPWQTGGLRDRPVSYTHLAMFERLLEEQLKKTMASLNEHEAEYREYLEASLSDLKACQMCIRDREDTSYQVFVDEKEIGEMKTNLGGKLALSVELDPSRKASIKIEKM